MRSSTITRICPIASEPLTNSERPTESGKRSGWWTGERRTGGGKRQLLPLVVQLPSCLRLECPPPASATKPCSSPAAPGMLFNLLAGAVLTAAHSYASPFFDGGPSSSRLLCH